MIVGDIVGMFPEAADIIMSYGLHCVGCHANSFETIEQGLLGHGYDEKHLKKLLEELNEFAEEAMSETPKKLPKEAEKIKISVTPVALKKIQSAAKEQEKVAILRVEARTVAGAQKYSMNFIKEDEIGKNEKIFLFARGKVRIVADMWEYKKINGLSIDYVVEKDREGFRLTQRTSRTRL